ncbi:MAG: Holliday junction resolvase [Thermoplasmata archaeon]
MRRGGSAYERELKEILQGVPDRIRRYARHLPPADRGEFERIVDRPFLVIRAAGSLGFDLVALRREFAFPLEVKSSREASVRFTANSGRALDQLASHRHAVERVGLMVLYAYRRVGEAGEEPWRLFSAGGSPSAGGVIGVLSRRLPPIETTREGNAILRWDSGMPLSSFVRTVRLLTEPMPPVAA